MQSQFNLKLGGFDLKFCKIQKNAESISVMIKTIFLKYFTLFFKFILKKNTSVENINLNKQSK